MSRVLVLTPWDRMWSLAGGGAPSWAYLIEGLLSAGHAVDVLAAPGETRDYPDHERLTVRRMAPLRAVVGPLARERTWIARTRALVAGARDYARGHGRPDLVYGFSALATPAASICAAGWRRPSVGKLFGTFLLPALGHPALMLERWDEAVGFRVPLTRLVVHDDGTGGDVVARHLRVPDGRLRFWRNGVDRDACATAIAALDRTALLAAHGVAADRPLVYTASRLVNWKRVDRIVAAMPALLERVPEAQLLVGGDGPERGALAALAARRGVARAVRFAGAVPRQANLQLMAAADAFCSTYDYSNLGNALLEAMCCGAAVVVTDSGRTRDLVAPDAAGLVVAPDDPAALATALATVLRDGDVRARLAAGARRAIELHVPGRDERIGWEVAMVEQLVGARRTSGVVHSAGDAA